MPAMRYQNPKLLDYLASAYVINSLTPLVHKRVKALSLQIPLLESLILKWQQDFNTLESTSKVIQPSENVWKAVNGRTSSSRVTVEKKRSPANWMSYIWTSFAAIYAVVLINMWVDTQSEVSLTPSYMAVLSTQEKQNKLIAVSYKGSEHKAPSIKFQKIDTNKFKVEEDLHVWTVAKETGKHTYIGAFDGQSIELTSTQWTAIKNAESVEVTEELAELEDRPTGKILLSGHCWQLESWKEG